MTPPEASGGAAGPGETGAEPPEAAAATAPPPGPPAPGPPALTLAAWGVAAAAAAVSVWVVSAEPRMESRPPPSLAFVALPHAATAALAWWGRRSATARWVALAGAALVFGLGAALWAAWVGEPTARLRAARLVPERQLVAVAVVAYVVSLARRSGR